MAAGMSDHKEDSPQFLAGLYKFYVSSKIRAKKSSSSNKKITIFFFFFVKTEKCADK
jgi:hypothetical protein